jgi:DNA-binding NarL/FixJ family response regulator
MSPIRILLVEDFIPYRNLIVKLLSKNPDLCVISEIDDGIEAVEQAQRLRPDLILMDIGLPRLNGLAAARQIFGLVPTAKIVYLTQMTDVDVVEEALSTGAAGYVLKHEAEHVLLAALATILKGNRFVSSGLSRNGSAKT